jgi:hypothetical protein
MQFVPGQVQYVSYVNYALVFSLSGNSSALGLHALFQIPQLNFTTYPYDVQSEVDIQLPSPGFSGTVNIIQLGRTLTSILSDRLTNSTGSQVIPYDGYAIHSLLVKEFGSQPTVSYLTIVNGWMIASNDKTSGLQNVQQILDQVSSNAPDLFDNVTVKQALYAAGATQNYVALFLGNFPTQLVGSSMVAKSVSYDGVHLIVTRAFQFSSLEAASTSLPQAQQVYSDAQFKILSSWLIVTNQYPLSQLQTEISGI